MTGALASGAAGPAAVPGVKPEVILPEVIFPEVHPDHCVHALCATATCRRCEVACPGGAWQLTDDGLFLDPTRCNGCGLCAAACMQEALRMPARALVLDHAGSRTALAACAQAVSAGGAGVLPCVQAIGLRDLARLAAQGVETLCLCTANCAACGGAGTTGIDEALATLNRILRARKLPPMHGTHVAEQVWLARRGPQYAADAVAPGRRRFLVNGMREVARLLADPEVPELPRSASARLARSGIGISEWRPQWDAARCVGCGACLRLCPTQALQHDAAAGVYRIHPDACTGCRLCSDVCAVQAIAPVALGAATPYEVPLAASRCSACGVVFQLPVVASTGRPLCPVCSAANHYRHLFQVLQSAEERPDDVASAPN